ncbi:MAG: hypothetical protein IPK19_09990 [Chloroflexi bacterium]|nr:hypothetical protein [Chloroflexota bacterium]
MRTSAWLLIVLSVFLTFSSFVPVQAQESVPDSPVVDNASAVALKWFALQRDIVRNTPGFTPATASRAFGYSSVVLHEAIAAGQLSGLGDLPQPESDAVYRWDAVANGALAEITRLMFPTGNGYRSAIIELHAETAAPPYVWNTEEAIVLHRSDAFGRQIAHAVYDWSLAEGG